MSAAAFRLRSLGGRVLRAFPPARRVLERRDRSRRQLRDAQQQTQRLRKRLAATRRELTELRASVGQWPPGHYYSPIPDLAEVRRRDAEIWAVPATLPGIEVRADEQLERLRDRFAAFYTELPFSDEPVDGLRYGFRNRFFSYGDGLALYGMLRDLQPKRLVEIGSGWSSALTLDVNDRFLGGDLRCTFVEPYAERLRELLRPADADRVEILEVGLHEVDPALFASLTAGDILFIDSTHVSRVGSDVNRLVFEVLPTLVPGVHVHVHDVFWPFEYPREWVYGGRAWNEAYVLRAYLTNNPAVRITWFNHYLQTFHADEVARAMPLWAKNPGGSLWFVTQ